MSRRKPKPPVEVVAPKPPDEVVALDIPTSSDIAIFAISTPEGAFVEPAPVAPLTSEDEPPLTGSLAELVLYTRNQNLGFLADGVSQVVRCWQMGRVFLEIKRRCEISWYRPDKSRRPTNDPERLDWQDCVLATGVADNTARRGIVLAEAFSTIEEVKKFRFIKQAITAALPDDPPNRETELLKEHADKQARLEKQTLEAKKKTAEDDAAAETGRRRDQQIAWNRVLGLIETQAPPDEEEDDTEEDVDTDETDETQRQPGGAQPRNTDFAAASDEVDFDKELDDLELDTDTLLGCATNLLTRRVKPTKTINVSKVQAIQTKLASLATNLHSLMSL